jgi:hypothetical protein
MKPIEEISDIVELQTWAGGKPATASALTEWLESALDEEETPDIEQKAQNVLDEFRNRQELLGSAYPFKTDGSKLELDHPHPAGTTYLFCLGLSLLPASEIQNEQRALQFETVVMNAAKSFFGGQALRIGAPWSSYDIPDYATLLDKVIELIPNLGEKLKTTAPDGGDAGWDVLIVKNFRDNQFPRFVALGNCATGRTDWKRKGMETQPTLFWSYFQSEHRSTFLTFFAVPFAMDEDARLRKLSSTCLTLDRFRICEHAPTTPLAETAAWLEGQRERALQIPLN